MKVLTNVLTMAALCGLCVSVMVSVADDAKHLAPQDEQMMEQFESTKEPDWLLRAIAATDRQKTNGVEEMIAIRIALLKRLTAYYDAAYDVNPPPPIQSHVMPPMGYDTGVSPAVVTDPKLREDYARRIAENKRNSQSHQIQTAIRQLMSKVVYLSLNAEHGNIRNVEMRLQGQELPKMMIDAMQALARESKKK